MLTSKTNKLKLTLFLYSVFIVLWWTFINIAYADKENRVFEMFAASYGLVCGFAAIVGVVQSRKWGYTRSYLGKLLLFLALGMAFTQFGQLNFSYYTAVKHIDIPYPSLADIGFFGVIPLYGLAALSLARMVRVKESLKMLSKPKLALIGVVPVAMVFMTVLAHRLTGASFDGDKLTVFLDFGYPFGQSIVVTAAILALASSNRLTGGAMKPKILLLILAFLLQYIADYNFLVQGVNETWINGGYGDLLYYLAYAVMAWSIISLSPDDMKGSKS